MQSSRDPPGERPAHEPEGRRHPMEIPRTPEGTTEPSFLPEDRDECISPAQMANLDHTSPLPITRQTVEMGLITRICSMRFTSIGTRKLTKLRGKIAVANESNFPTASADCTLPAEGAASPLTSPPPSPTIELGGDAFQLGWVMASLHGPLLRRDDRSHGHLPTLNEMAAAVRVPIAAEEIAVSVTRLATFLSLPDKDPISVDALVSTWDVTAPDLSRFLTALLSLHIEIIGRLQASSPSLADAYSLGRALCDTCWLPRDESSFNEAFNPGRVGVLVNWLKRTQVVLPQDAGQAVGQSLTYWRIWNGVFSSIPGAWEAAHEQVVGALRHQGDLWRSVLTGQQPAQSFMSIDGYVQAAEGALRRARQAILRVAAHYWLALLVTVLMTAGFVWLAVNDSSGTARVWSTLGSVGAGLGVTGGTIRGGLQRLVTNAGRPLWAISEVEAMASAITALPTFDLGSARRHDLRKEGVAAGKVPGVGGTKILGDRTTKRRAFLLLPRARPLSKVHEPAG